jgi:mannosyltransferase OCH1-like enzyme
MKKDRHKEVLSNDFSRQTYGMFKQLYEKNNFKRVQPISQVKIPKIIHQIWLGSPFPEEYKQFQQSWKKYHPDWEYRLWTEEEIQKLNLINQDLYDASVNYGEKSDIVRYELLYQFGGLYADTDFECLKPLDILHHTYDFYIGVQPLDTNFSQLGIGLMGSVPGHPLMRHCIGGIRHNNTRQIILRTGPIHCTKVFHRYAGQGMLDIALPASYFYPCDFLQKGLPASSWQRPESFAIHHWEASWTKPEGFIAKSQKS